MSQPKTCKEALSFFTLPKKPPNRIGGQGMFFTPVVA